MKNRDTSYLKGKLMHPIVKMGCVPIFPDCFVVSTCNRGTPRNDVSLRTRLSRFSVLPRGEWRGEAISTRLIK